MLAFNLYWLSNSETVFDFSVNVLIRGVSFTAMMTVMPALAMSNLSKEGLDRGDSRYLVFGSIGFIFGSVVLPMFLLRIQSFLMAGACILSFSIFLLWGLIILVANLKNWKIWRREKGCLRWGGGI